MPPRVIGIGTALSQFGWFNAAQDLTVLGLDMALVSTGWATISNGNLSCGVWAPKEYRCGTLSNEAESILVSSKPNVIAIEDATFQKSFESHQIGMASGAILSKVETYLWANKGTALLKIHPTRLKYFCHRSKEATKEHVQKYIIGMLNVCGVSADDILPEDKRKRGDVCDAVTLALMGLIAHGINHSKLDPTSLGKNADFFTTSEKHLCGMLAVATT